MAGALAVLEIRVPEGAGAQLTADLRYMVAKTARGLDAKAGFDADLGHYVILVPAARQAEAPEALEQLMLRVSGLEVAHERYSARPAIGVGIVELTGRPAEVEPALADAIDLAQASRTERALRPHIAPSGPARRVRGAGPVRRWYFGLSARRKAWALATANVILAWIIPLAVYVAVLRLVHVDVTTPLFWIVFSWVLLTAATVYAEAFLALRPETPAAVELSQYPAASAVIVAFLPNEADTIVDTVRSVLAQDYPGPLEVILAYNTPRPLPIEQDLAALAAVEPRLVLLRVGDSSSKAQNVNAALQVVSGEFVGVFDADHRPMPDAFRRAARWLEGGADVVQGRSVVRNGSHNWLARMVAVEFEGIYAVAHPGRAALHGFGIFGGSNGFWRTELLERLRMRPDMLTEDIDVSIRAVFGGSRIAVDPKLISEELSPLTPMALWSQRIRWSQGWHQVSRQQLRRVWVTPYISVRQRLGASFLLGWREMYPWVAAQMIPILAFSLLVRNGIHIQFVLPLFILVTLYVSAVGPIQALFAWRLAVPELRRRRRWWLQYVLISGTLFGEYKAHVNRAAHLRELVGDRAWQVTPRTSGRMAVETRRTQVEERPSTIVSMGASRGTLRTVALDVSLGETGSGVPVSFELGDLTADLTGDRTAGLTEARRLYPDAIA